MVIGLPKIVPHNGVCEGCVLSENYHAPLNSRMAWRVKQPFELHHIDLCCMTKPSLVGVKYILTFIDDLSKFT